MKIVESQGISDLSRGITPILESALRSMGCLANRAFQEPSTLTHPAGVRSPHPKFRRIGLLARCIPIPFQLEDGRTTEPEVYRIGQDGVPRKVFRLSPSRIRPRTARL